MEINFNKIVLTQFVLQVLNIYFTSNLLSNQPKNIYDNMVLFNHLALRNILNRQDDLGTPEVCMAVAALAEEQKADALLFLNNYIEALAALPSGRGSLTVELVKRLLDGMPTFEPKTGVCLRCHTQLTNEC